jgi:cytochrome c553
MRLRLRWARVRALRGQPAPLASRSGWQKAAQILKIQGHFFSRLEDSMPSWVRLGAISAALACGALASAALAQSPPVNGNPARGKVLSQTCLGCHGVNGYRNAYPNYEVPKLWGQSPDYIVTALEEYKSGVQRTHPTMHAQASELSEQEMEDIAAYFGSQPLRRETTPASAHTPPAAAAVCVACHGADGVGVVAQYPSLAGQHPDYLVQAIREYKDGARKNPVMVGMSTPVTEDNLWVIADYYASLKPSLRTLPRPETFLSLRR